MIFRRIKRSGSPYVFLIVLILAAVGVMVALHPLAWVALVVFLVVSFVAVFAITLLIVIGEVRDDPAVPDERIERQLAAGKALYGEVLRFLDGATYDGVNDPDRPSDWTKGEFTRDGTRELIGALIGFRAAERDIEL